MLVQRQAHFRQGLTEAQRRRQGRRSVAVKVEDARLRQKRQHFEQLLSMLN